MTNTVEDIFPLPAILEILRQQVSETKKIYLVGGAVRDLLMQRHGHDLDFVVTGDVLPVARKVADAIGAAFYVLDAERQIARVIYQSEAGQRWYLDFSLIRGATIQEDLQARDFTINAIAIGLDQLDRFIDPLNGAQAIKDRQLRICSQNSFMDDPLRVLRAVRLSADLGFKIPSDTLAGLKAAIPELSRVSVERQRDELFHILESRHATLGLRTGFMLGIFQKLLPEVTALQGEIQAAPHVYDVFDHTLAQTESLRSLYDLLVEPYAADKGSNLIFGLALMEIGRYREDLQRHFAVRLNPDRSLFGLMMLAALLHDGAKPFVRTIDGDGRMHFFEHDALGAEMAAQRGKDLALSTGEVDRLTVLVRHHMRIHHLAKSDHEVSRRSIYRYFRDLGDAGVDMVLFSLADKLATYGVTITPADWQKELHIGRQLLEAWFVNKEAHIQPVKLITGSDLIAELQLQPGPQFGDLLEAVREAQAIGQVGTREEALEFAREWVNNTSRGMNKDARWN
ncbi:MAG: CCA tRNA nucleotidyltransferase [Bellilinea sp.]